MIYDSVLVCHFPRDAFTTLNQKIAEQFLWGFLKDLNVLQISTGERWLEIQCGKSISQHQIQSLNSKLQQSIQAAVNDYDVLQHCTLYLKIMYEMGRLAEGVAQIINVKDSTMCHGVASELLTNIKQFAGHSLPQQLQLYHQSQQAFSYMDLPDFHLTASGVGGVGNKLGPTAPMTSTGVANDQLAQQQYLLNQLARINYMQQMNTLNPSLQFNANLLPLQQLQQQQQSLQLQKQQLLLQQQMSELAKTSGAAQAVHGGLLHELPQQAPNMPHIVSGNAASTNLPGNDQSRISFSLPPGQSSQQQLANKELHAEWDQIMKKVEKKKKKKKASKKSKKQKKKGKKQRGSDSSADSEEDSDSNDSDDDDDDDDEEEDEEEEEEEDEEEEEEQDSDDTSSDESGSSSSASDDDSSDDSDAKKKKKAMKKGKVEEEKKQNYIAGVDDDDDMKYPPIPFSARVVEEPAPVVVDQREEDLDTIFNEHDAFKGKMKKRKSKKNVKNKKSKNTQKSKKKKSSKRKKNKSKRKLDDDTDEEAESTESDEDTEDSDDSNSDSNDEEEEDSEEEDDEDEAEEEEEDGSDDTDDDDDEEEEEEEDADGTQPKSGKKEEKNFEKDLDLLLNGQVDEYIKKNMPMEIAMSPKEDSATAAVMVNLDELRPHSLSIQIKDVEMLQREIGDVKHEDSDDDEEEPHNNIPDNHDERELDDAKESSKTRNRKIDRILRGSKDNLNYTKRVLGMFESDRHTPQTKEVEINERSDVNALYAAAAQEMHSKQATQTVNQRGIKKRHSQKIAVEDVNRAQAKNGNASTAMVDKDNKHKLHLDNMINNILAGKEFVPFTPDPDPEPQPQLEHKAHEDRTRLSDDGQLDDDEDAQDKKLEELYTTNDDKGKERDEIEAIEMDIKAAMEDAKRKRLQKMNNGQPVNAMMAMGLNAADDDDEDVDDMFGDNNQPSKPQPLPQRPPAAQPPIQQQLQQVPEVPHAHNINMRDLNIDEAEEMVGDNMPSLEQFSSLIKTAIGPTAMDPTNTAGHHKRQSTRLLLDSLRPSTSYGINPNVDESDLMAANVLNSDDDEDAYGMNGQQRLAMMGGDQDAFDEKQGITRHITWGMILIELDNFDKLLQITAFDRTELIEVIQNLIDESLEYQNQYVDHMTEGQFVLLTPVDIMITPQEIRTIENKIRNSTPNLQAMGNVNIVEDEYFYEKKEDRLRDIAASVLQHLSQEEEGLEFCMGVALQDRVSSDQEWFEIARESLEEMKAYREFDRSRRKKQQQQQGLMDDPQSSHHSSFNQLHSATDTDTEIAERLRRRSAKYTGHPRERNSVLNLFNAINMVSDLDYQDENGDTALIIACGSRRQQQQNDNEEIAANANINVVNAIIDNGCNINLRNKEGMTALMFAAMNGDNEVVKRLCDLGAKLEIKGITTQFTKTALLFAAENGHKTVVATLLMYGADLNSIYDDDESNVLMLCVKNGHIDTIQYILKYNQKNNYLLDINAQNKYGYTALMIAAKNGNEHVVELLLHFGADRDIKNRQNLDAYSIARKSNHINICQMLFPSL